MEGTTTLGPEGVTNLVFRATPDLARIGSVVTLPDDVSARGKVDVDVRLESPVQNFREARFLGNIQAMDIHATHPGLGVPLGIPSGEVQLSGTKAAVRDLPLLLGGDQVLISGELSDLFALLLPEQTPHFQGTLRGSRLNLPELSPRPRPDPNLSYGKVAFAKVGDRPVGGGSFRSAAEDLGLSRPENLPLGGSLDLALDTVIDSRGRMENLRAHVDFGPSFMEVTEASFKRFGGEIHTTLDLSLGSPEAAPFSFSLDVRELDAGGFLSGVTPLGETVRGTISMELDLIGTLDGFLLPDRPALVGSATFSLSDGGLKSTPLTQAISAILGMESLREPSIEDWTGSLVVEQGRILLANATIHGVPGNPEVGGRVGLNGELDLRSAFALPSDRLSTSALDRLGIAGDIAARVAQRPEVVQAVLRIGGSFANPAVEADPYAAARTLGQAVEEEVRAEAQARIDAEKARAEEALEEQRAEAQRRIQEQKNELKSRATGFLQDLMRPRDTSPPTSAAPDTLVSDTMQLDSLRPDTIRPDTAAADSIRPDTLGFPTLRPDTMRSDTVRPDTMRPDTVRSDTVRPDTMRPDTMRSDTVRPDTMRPDTVRPDTIRPDTMRPDTMRPDTAWRRLSPWRLSWSPPPPPGRKPGRAPGRR
jgi:pentapeptide MXKDX repeat protein